MSNEPSWDGEMAKVECQLNNSHDKTIGDTPFKVLYGYYANFEDGALASIVAGNQVVQNVKDQIFKQRSEKELFPNTNSGNCV